MDVRPCVGCGYCCLKAPCAVGVHKHKLKAGDRCPSLRWITKERRYICRLVLREPKYRKDLAIGEGCCSPLNTWRKEVKERG